MRRFILLLGLIVVMFLTACAEGNILQPITSLRFTPLNFPHSNLGEFTLNDSSHKEQLELFLEVFKHTFSKNKIDDRLALEDLPITFSLQLFSDNKLTAIYRLSFDFEKDIAFLQNENHIYSIDQDDFHQIIETGYFNVIFRKNHAPTAKFLLNNNEIKYSVNGIWKYETYHNNFLSYQINKEQDQDTKYIVTDDNFELTYFFPDKQPDEVYETIRLQESVIESKKLLHSEKINIPSEEGTYIYEIEGVWSDLSLPYKASLKYQFKIEVNYPPKIRVDKAISPGEVAVITVDSYDTNGKVSIASDMWNKEIPLILINEKYYGLLPIPINTEPGEYKLNISGSNSPENLQQTETIYVRKSKNMLSTLSKKHMDIIKTETERDSIYQVFISNKTNFSADEKLWSGNFTKPTTLINKANYGQQLIYHELSYQYFKNVYALDEGEVHAAANGIVRIIEEPLAANNKYTLLVDHGLGLFSIYGGISEVNVTAGNYVFAGQKIGSTTQEIILPKNNFDFIILVHGYYVNPNLFFERDIIPLYR